MILAAESHVSLLLLFATDDGGWGWWQANLADAAPAQQVVLLLRKEFRPLVQNFDDVKNADSVFQSVVGAYPQRRSGSGTPPPPPLYHAWHKKNVLLACLLALLTSGCALFSSVS